MNFTYLSLLIFSLILVCVQGFNGSKSWHLAPVSSTDSHPASPLNNFKKRGLPHSVLIGLGFGLGLVHVLQTPEPALALSIGIGNNKKPATSVLQEGKVYGDAVIMLSDESIRPKVGQSMLVEVYNAADKSKTKLLAGANYKVPDGRLQFPLRIQLMKENLLVSVDEYGRPGRDFAQQLVITFCDSVENKKPKGIIYSRAEGVSRTTTTGGTGLESDEFVIRLPAILQLTKI